jgi:hypothetical protein
MNTGDPIDAFIAVVALIVLFTPVLLLMFVVEWLLDRPTVAPRRRQRIPAREMELIGDDYRECVADYFASFSGSEKKGKNHDDA